VPDDRTCATELGTALGTLGHPDLATALARRPTQLKIDADMWEQLAALHRGGSLATEFDLAFANGRALLEATDGLRGRIPVLVEWTGGRRPPGDEVAPIDLRIDHVYLVSCKYDSDILANTSPGRLFDGLLATTGSWDRADWYHQVAPDEFGALYAASLVATGLTDLPDTPGECSREQHRRLRTSLAGRTFPDAVTQAAYAELCRTVSIASAARWSAALEATGAGGDVMLWRLLRIGSAPYFVLGIDRRRGVPVQFRIASPWDWREGFELLEFVVTPGSAGQPRVDWKADYRSRHGDRRHPVSVAGHIEIRWSHGRFAQPPEAKVYLDTPMEELPGYHPLTHDGGSQLRLWPGP
jgi:hypothetical protein